MMQPVYFRPLSAVLLVCVLAFSGCLGSPAKTPATRYYILNSTYSAKNKPQPVAVLNDAVVGIGPIKLSRVLDRPQIVTRTGKNEIRVVDLVRWAGPLHEIVANVMVDNLTALLPGTEILKFPWPVTIPVTYQVAMDITRFDGMPGGDVTLRSRWGILGEGGKKILANKQTALNEPIGGNTIGEMVNAQSRLLEKLCYEIAVEIKGLEEKRTRQ
ncbi:MAG: PqiC family protein [Deltaproteobacteria bacterium]|jgi:uncharacterized lipoprotein YmbA